MKRLSLLALVLGSLLVLGAGCFTTTVDIPTSNTNTEDQTNGNVQGAETASFSVSLSIEDGVGEPQLFSVDVEPDTTALDLLHRVANEEAFSVTTKKYDFGELIEGIGDKMADTTHFWSFFLNDEVATVGAGAYALQAGDLVSFRYLTME